MATLRSVPTCGQETARACIACRHGEILLKALVVSSEPPNLSPPGIPPTIWMNRWDDAQDGEAWQAFIGHNRCMARGIGERTCSDMDASGPSGIMGSP